MDQNIAGKTGTTNDNFDAWFIGYNSNLVVGVYIGFDTPKTLGNKETGGKVATPIFADFIKKALTNQSSIPLLVPEGIEMIKVYYKSGKKVNKSSKTKNQKIKCFSEAPESYLKSFALIIKFRALFSHRFMHFFIFHIFRIFPLYRAPKGPFQERSD